MPTIRNSSGLTSIVSVERAQELVRDDGAVLLNVSDRRPGAPEDKREVRTYDKNAVHNKLRPTVDQFQKIAEDKEAKNAADAKALQERQNPPPPETPKVDEPATLGAIYKSLFGKKPHHKKTADTIRNDIKIRNIEIEKEEAKKIAQSPDDNTPEKTPAETNS